MVKRIQQLERLAFATREDIAAMPVCIGSYDKLLKRLEDKVFGNLLYMSPAPCSVWSVSGTINTGNTSSYTISSVPLLYKPKLKVGDTFLGIRSFYKISTIAMCYCAKTNQMVLAYCCGHGKSFNCELLDKYLNTGTNVENILL